MPSFGWRKNPNHDRRLYRQELEDVGAVCYAYKYSPGCKFLYYLLTILLLGIPSLLARWFQRVKLKLICYKASLADATVVLIRDDSKSYFICDVHEDYLDATVDSHSVALESSTNQYSSSSPLCSAPHNVKHYRYFVFRHEKFIWDSNKERFIRLYGLGDTTCAEMLDKFQGMSHQKRMELRKLHGPNNIEVEVSGYIKLLFDEVLNPFYCFQVLSILLWSFDEYYYYATCVVIISAISILMTLRETRQQQEMLRSMATANADFLVTVRRWDREEEEISCRDLVPGDVLVIPPDGIVLPVDAVLCTGSCVVNESMLTGESVPVTKGAIQSSDEIFNEETHKRHTLFNGTQVIQTRFYAGNKVTCVVVRTGYSTLKGQLIKSMLFPKEIGFQFYVDAMKFVGMLFCIATIGMVYCMYLYVERDTKWTVALVRVLDIITIVVPPALPAAMTVGTFYAQARLKLRQIYCISPPRINFCGKVSLVAFDKTGTLTEDGLDFGCVVPFDETTINFAEAATELDTMSSGEISHYLRCCATCHSLTYINGRIVGDPMDLKMFAATGWEFEEPLPTSEETRKYDMLMPNVVKRDDVEIGILRELEFTPQLQRMSVVVRPLDAPMTVYCKGAPERLRALCINRFPPDYDRVLDSFTLKGYRVLSLAYRIVKYKWHEIQRLDRSEIEKDLIFCGFLVMQNSLKPATIPTVEILNNANIRSVMVTGDNLLTALSVARECGMISSDEKVIIVSASDDDGPPKLSYTLAAHHFEVNGNDPQEEELFKAESLDHIFARENQLETSLGDVTIDMDRLVPIPDRAQEMQSSGSNTVDYHFALTGKTWTSLMEYFPSEVVDRIIAKATVFARMSPECKSQMVESFQNLGYIVAMCGDGANDCSALKMAHVGVSLSEAEASVAAPFTSKIQDISAVPHVIREGRCALATSFSVFKFMALYSMVQFISVIILYTKGTNFADTQFLYIDLGITTTVAVVMGRTEPYPILVTKRPMASLISFTNVASILLHILTAGAFQLAALMYLEQQAWFAPVEYADPINFICWETTTIFLVSSFQYITLAIVFSKGPPFRKAVYANIAFVIATLVLTSITATLLIHPPDVLADFFYLIRYEPKNADYRLILAAFPSLNLLLALGLENLVVKSTPMKKLGIALRCKKPKHRFRVLLDELSRDPYWPPIRLD